MNPNVPTQTSSVKKTKMVWLACGVVVFGVLMGERGQLESKWQRSLAAASAALILVFCISQSKKLN